MDFSIEKSQLLKELALTQGVVEKKTTIPILSNLLVEAEEGILRISATDLDLGVTCHCPAKVKIPGSGTIPAKRLLEIVRSLPEAEVHFKALENHWVQLTCERSSFKLVGMARDNFPMLPTLRLLWQRSLRMFLRPPSRRPSSLSPTKSPGTP